MKPIIPTHKEEKGHSLWHKNIKKEEGIKITLKERRKKTYGKMVR
jgi:hypothetical protein